MRLTSIVLTTPPFARQSAISLWMAATSCGWGGELPTRMITFFASLRHLSWRIAHSRPSFTASSQSPPPSATMPSRKVCTFFTLKVRSVHLTTKASLCRGPPGAPRSSSRSREVTAPTRAVGTRRCMVAARPGHRRRRHDDRLGGRRPEQLLEGLLGVRIVRRHRRGQVLEREDLPPPLRAEAHAAARPDAEAGTDAEAEAAARAEHVEVEHEGEERMRRRRDPEGGQQAPRAWPGRRVERGERRIYGCPAKRKAVKARSGTPSPPEPRAQRPRLRAAERNLAAHRIAHDELVAAAEPGDDLLHVLQVHEVRLVGAEEERRVEALLEVAQRVVGHEGALGGVRVDQAVLDPEPEHVGDRHDQDALSAVHRDLAHVDLALLLQPLEHALPVGGAVRRAEAGTHAPHRLFDAPAAEWLQQVVHRADLEGADRVLVVGGGEHDVPRRLAERLQHLEAVHPRHLDVEEDEVRALLLDQPEGLHAVGRLPEEAHVVQAGQETDQAVARQLLVVDDHGADGAHRYAARAGRTGRRSRTRVPLPGALVISGWWAGP